jgi:hypothetical protein
MKISLLSNCAIVLLKASYLHVGIAKWYLEQLITSQYEMTRKYALKNDFETNFELQKFLALILHQRLGYIPQSLFQIFRDFCALLYYVDIRDKFSLNLRKYCQRIGKNKDDDNLDYDLSLKRADMLDKSLIDSGNLMLSYRTFLKEQHHEIQMIVLDTITRLTTRNSYDNTSDNSFEDYSILRQLALCQEKKPAFLIDSNGIKSIITLK